ncbi:hypothetical protein GCE9029_01437 [Grimontia celer]|uniref:Uncharacterized protein n=1 Tax=Grimontia celer TaxID=1796497 RepID=A0A128EY08_9GAMM|nr:hypothetical protein [Grimontia celer]CZF79397.1 hypothetical protein GCE9029_01437 [Grimontia celer]
MFRETLSDAFEFSVSHKSRLFQITFLPVLVGLAFDSIPPELTIGWLNLAENIVKSIFLTIIAVNVHRLVLLGNDSVPKWGRIKAEKIERRFILYYLAILLLANSAFFVISWLGFLTILFELTLAMIICRLSLIFPAIASGQPETFSLAWDKTSQKTWYMFGVVSAVPLLLMLFMMISSVLEPPVWPFRVLSYLVFIFGLVTLSMAYRKLNERYEEKISNKEHE